MLCGLLDGAALHAVVPEDKARLLSLRELAAIILQSPDTADAALLATLRAPDWASRVTKEQLVEAASSHVRVGAAGSGGGGGGATPPPPPPSR